MGDWYEFDFIEVSGEWVSGAVFQNKDTNYNPRQLQLTESQKSEANNWLKKHDDLIKEKQDLINSFILSPDSNEITQLK